MAKSKRSSVRKANNQRLAATVFGPAEAARAERLSAKLLELAKQPKPETSDAKMEGKSERQWDTEYLSHVTNETVTIDDADVVEDAAEAGDATGTLPATITSMPSANTANNILAMDVDKKRPTSKRIGKRIDKRKSKKASIVFPKYSDRIKAKKNKKKA